MVIIFGTAFDQSFFPIPQQTEDQKLYLGPMGLLNTLENHLGFSGHRNDIEFLRIEQYRQLILRHLQDHPNTFYLNAFQADQFATAADLLSRRDELLAAGYSFSAQHATPDRLNVLVEIETYLNQDSTLQLSPGFADRLETIIESIPFAQLPFQELHYVEPLQLLNPAYQRLFQVLHHHGLQLIGPTPPSIKGGDDLQQLQTLLQGQQKDTFDAQGDGSLLFIKGKRDTDLAAFFAGLVRKNPNLKPTMLLSGPAQVLDNAFIQEGLPSLGIRATSLSRPPLQLLKLATCFLWSPLDPYKILEFVSLPVQPLDNELAFRIAQQIAQSPGINSEGWKVMIARYFASLEERFSKAPDDKEKIKMQYRFWFERQQFDANASALKSEAIQIFDFLSIWARESATEGKSLYDPLLTLADKAQKIKELLEELPEQELSRLELERVVRTIYEPAPLLLNEKQLEALPVVTQSDAIYGPASKTLWWNFVQHEPAYFFSKWYQSELAYLQKQKVYLQQPKDKNQQLIWQRKQAVLWTQNQLIFLIPSVVEGKEVQAHPLMGNIEAAISNLSDIYFNIDIPEDRARLQQYFQLPESVQLTPRPLGATQNFIQVPNSAQLATRETETFTSLESLLYYPYQWVFKYLLGLRKSPILSITPESTLQGNLAHRLLEKLLLEPKVYEWSKMQVYQWIDQAATKLFYQEGAVLLLYGKEPLRVSFVKKVQFAAWSLLDSLKSNGWEIFGLEKDLEGHFEKSQIKGRADLILRRGAEWAILDLKWRGISRRRAMIRNQEDLQLVLYAYLLNPTDNWAHTAYFIIDRGELIARNQEAFQEVEAITPDLDTVQTYEQIIDKMRKTYNWRIEQIREGTIEVRSERTAAALEEEYGDTLDLLEMKQKDAPFDDYRTLINLFG